MAHVASAWHRLWGPHPEVSDRSVRFQTAVWVGISLIWLAALVLAVTFAAPTSGLQIGLYVLALLAAAANAAVWLRVGRLRREPPDPDLTGARGRA
jgi:hypothetical protein